MAASTPMTKEGHQKLQEELKHLKNVERPKIVKAIEEARGHGDLSENAEYHAAKEKQSFLETRIMDIQGKLANANIIDTSRLSSDKVVFGATVTLLDVDTEETVRYRIVGEDESDIKAGKISVHSPIARALIGKNKEDEVEVTTPRGQRFFEILAIDFE